MSFNVLRVPANTKIPWDQKLSIRKYRGHRTFFLPWPGLRLSLGIAFPNNCQFTVVLCKCRHEIILCLLCNKVFIYFIKFTCDDIVLINGCDCPPVEWAEWMKTKQLSIAAARFQSARFKIDVACTFFQLHLHRCSKPYCIMHYVQQLKKHTTRFYIRTNFIRFRCTSFCI